MFKFNFYCNDLKDEEKTEDLIWLPTEEVGVELEELKKYHYKSLNIKMLHIGKVDLKILSRDEALMTISMDKSVPNNTKVADDNHSDLEPSKYEGGLKIWECTYDLSNYLMDNFDNLKGKDVLDMGCGAGILGLLSLKLDANAVCFQDYNIEVIKHWTIVNVSISVEENKWSHCKFWAGDWGSFAQMSSNSYDIILMSETIYNPNNYSKIIEVLRKKLKPNGIVLLAAKSYYFGLSGSLHQFEELLMKENFNYKPVFKTSEGVQREIIEIRAVNETDEVTS